VGKKKEQNVLSNWWPINTKPVAERQPPNFLERITAIQSKLQKLSHF